MRIAIQGELGSNSHMAVGEMFARAGETVDVVSCPVSAEVLGRVISGEVDGAVLPIENSLHGSVAEHYDLLLEQPVRIVQESLMRIRHNVIGLKGVALEEIITLISHPVALAQCRRWQRAHSEMVISPFYDTAGSVKHIVAGQIRDMAAVAPALAADVYGAEVLVRDIEDHAENYTRFHLVVRDELARSYNTAAGNKMTVAFAVEHRPGTLVGALEGLAQVGADLTKIESRPVPGRPWEYIFYVDLRFSSAAVADAAVAGLRERCSLVKELGRYAAASVDLIPSGQVLEVSGLGQAL